MTEACIELRGISGRERVLYRHDDGMPEYVIPRLLRANQLGHRMFPSVVGRPIMRHVEQLAHAEGMESAIVATDPFTYVYLVEPANALERVDYTYRLRPSETRQKGEMTWDVEVQHFGTIEHEWQPLAVLQASYPFRGDYQLSGHYPVIEVWSHWRIPLNDDLVNVYGGYNTEAEARADALRKSEEFGIKTEVRIFRCSTEPTTVATYKNGKRAF